MSQKYSQLKRNLKHSKTKLIRRWRIFQAMIGRNSDQVRSSAAAGTLSSDLSTNPTVREASQRLNADRPKAHTALATLRLRQGLLSEAEKEYRFAASSSGLIAFCTARIVGLK